MRASPSRGASPPAPPGVFAAAEKLYGAVDPGGEVDERLERLDPVDGADFVEGGVEVLGRSGLEFAGQIEAT